MLTIKLAFHEMQGFWNGGAILREKGEGENQKIIRIVTYYALPKNFYS